MLVLLVEVKMLDTIHPWARLFFFFVEREGGREGVCVFSGTLVACEEGFGRNDGCSWGER